SPLSFRTAGFPRYGCKADISDGAFPNIRQLKTAPSIHRQIFGLRPPFVPFRGDIANPALCRAERSIAHRRGGWVVLRPRGPRSDPSYAVSSRHHLIDPIRPTHEHIAISPHGGLYAMPSLCGSAEATRGWFRAFATIPSWHAALYDPGEFDHRSSRTSMPRWPSPRSEQLSTPDPPAIRFTRGTYFGAS